MNVDKETYRKEYLATATAIIQGLLASGHYTIGGQDDFRTIPPQIIHRDNSKNWKELGHLRRFDCHAIQDAMNTAEELMGQIEQDVNLIFDDHSKDEVTEGKE